MLATRNKNSVNSVNSLLKELQALKEEKTTVTVVPKKPTWDRQAFWKDSDLAFLVKEGRETEYNATFGCDVWVAKGTMHFKTGRANGTVTKGFSDWKDALDFLSQMISAGVQGCYDIAKNSESGLWYIIPAPVGYGQPKKDKK